MVTISSIVETTAVLSDEQDKRYEYTKVFKNEKGKKVLLIMLNASGTNQIHTMDNTTNLTISNCIFIKVVMNEGHVLCYHSFAL